jgi:hypothetical protein
MGRDRHRGNLLAVIAAVALAAVLSACGATSAPTTHTPAPTASASVSGVVREATNPDPNFDYGFTVQIDAGAVRPHWLVAACCQAITWVNRAGTPVTVVFDHLAVNSGPIPPGGSYGYTPKNVESIAYHVTGATSITGVVQVNPTIEP